MANIPQSVLDQCPLVEGLPLLGRGKVRETYDLPGYPEHMLVKATRRISINDFVLLALIPYKDQVLTAMNIFWRLLFGSRFAHDLVAFGPAIDQYLPERLRGDIELWKTAVVVKKLKMIPIEGVPRGYITGSAFKQYSLSQTRPRIVYGYELTEGLVDGSLLDPPIFTTTTKAETGHDEEIAVALVRERYGTAFERSCMDLYQEAHKFAREHGVLIADTKWEGDKDGCLGDEWLTPDSSRFWPVKAYAKALAKGTLPPSMDKQFVRDWGKTVFIDKDKSGRKREPENPEDQAYVHSQSMPDAVVRMTTGIYRHIFWRFPNLKLEDFQRQVMHIPVPERCLRIEVLIGSKSDLPQAAAGLALLEAGANVCVRVMSCDRNPLELAKAAPEFAQADVIIAGAGMSARLPSAVKSNLCAIDHPEVPVIGVAFMGDSNVNNEAARLAISQVPGQPVEMDEDDVPYSGEVGFITACKAALSNEFMPKQVQKKDVLLIKDFS